ncbi:hypothetical protein LguiB_012356 [Lonicera macranthoides]
MAPMLSPGVSLHPQVPNSNSDCTIISQSLDNGPVEISPPGGGTLGLNSAEIAHLDSDLSSSINSVESIVPNTFPDKLHTSANRSSDSIHSSTPTQPTSFSSSSNRFAPLTGKFWGDEEEEPPIQSFIHSAEENLGLSDPRLCIELGEDLDTSVLNQDTPDNLKGTGYLSSLYSDSSPSISRTLYSPSESEYQPSSPINTSPSTSSPPFTPSVPLIVTTTNKAKKRQAKKEQAEKEAMLRAGISQSSIDFCFRKEVEKIYHQDRCLTTVAKTNVSRVFV